ncbi:MAG: Type-2 restriction enzyme TthHB8I [Parcubacteria group bacterium GW2011_GWB1_35_5]|nr:MAG: Type-2 restriction enzyme TthHB8I [Parcubacteria group bacterium GW2011_GWB1_35_5]
MKKNLERFNTFLKAVDLMGYREKFRPVKIVEMDLPKEVQAINMLYEVYWNQKKFLTFEDFYEAYLNSQKKEIESFRQKITMCEDCYYRGLPARIYRTWASIITQIHAGYVAESVFGDGSVMMSGELDHQGADFQVKYKGKILNYQVKKKSFSGEVRRGKGGVKKQIEGEFIDINYEVPSSEYFDNPRKKDGEYKLPYKRFIDNKELEKFPNGFVVFTSHTFLPKKKEIDVN